MIFPGFFQENLKKIVLSTMCGIIVEVEFWGLRPFAFGSPGQKFYFNYYANYLFLCTILFDSFHMCLYCGLSPQFKAHEGKNARN